MSIASLPERGTRSPAGRVPPGPPLWATPRLFTQLATDRIRLMAETADRYGDAVRLRIGPKTLYFFNHPDSAKHVLADHAANYRKGIGLVQAKRAIGDGLLTSEGELWRTQRRLIQPAFQHRRLAGQADVVAAEAGALATRLAARIGAGPVNVVDEMTTFTLGVLGRTLLEADLGGFAGIGHAFETVQDQAMFEMVTLSLIPTWVPLPRQLRFRRARAELGRIVAALAAGRRSADGSGDGGQGEDVLSRLVASARAEADPRVGARRMRDELVTLLLAGHETTASTISWTLYLLDRHPEALRRVHDEAVAVLGDRLPTHEDLRALPYTGAVVQEAMRLYPPVWMLPRQTIADDEIAGVRVPAGSDVVICPYTLHRNPEFWDRPDAFDPDRFGPDAPPGRPRYAYLPFGAGPRFCVGSHLGTMEAIFVLACVARDLRLRGIPGRVARPEAMLSLRIRDGLPMTVHPV